MNRAWFIAWLEEESRRDYLRLRREILTRREILASGTIFIERRSARS